MFAHMDIPTESCMTGEREKVLTRVPFPMGQKSITALYCLTSERAESMGSCEEGRGPRAPVFVLIVDTCPAPAFERDKCPNRSAGLRAHM